jgi:hypothetical protein
MIPGKILFIRVGKGAACIAKLIRNFLNDHFLEIIIFGMDEKK